MTDSKNSLELSATELLAAFASDTVSVSQHVEHVLRRIDQLKWLNSFVNVDPDGLRNAARAADEELATGKAGPLCGLPVTCKDNIETASLPTTAGTPALTARKTEDAPVMHRLLEAGGLLVGKTNMHELAFGITSNNFYIGPVRNPYNRDRVAGGSSGGAAAAVAARITPVGLATDTGGSARIPAALCGVVGFRPTTGRYPDAGLVRISSTRDTVGVIAGCVSDVALLDSTLADEEAAPPPVLEGVRIGVPRNYFYEDLDPHVAAAIEESLAALRKHGVLLIEENLPEVGELDAAAGFPVALYEARRELGSYAEAAGLNLRNLTELVASPDVRDILVNLTQDPVDDESYAVALEDVRELRLRYANYFRENRVEAMVMPTVPLPAPPIGDDEFTWHNGRMVPVFPTLIRNTSPGSLAGVPGLTLPLLASGAASPFGIALDGPAGRDTELLALGRAVERILPEVPHPALAGALQET